MRGPLHFLWNARIIGGYLRFRVELLVAGLLAMGGAVVAFEIGGVVGIFALSGLVFLCLVAVAVALRIR